ncbi:monovalent cation/H(+) antiporter subunit G [Sediminispirochaeta bajacaliforniensis]|uniref:monovalent cation/H(+) antiporter subunit G n=1 Tax=Sediminispirochaeta bajacaliforniensis TaxID=148 RepID=UPI000382D482|nr:monovalent cation/H(+) antiporter subunit G [Sediminispirochaeta bajacaliforniensis]
MSWITALFFLLGALFALMGNLGTLLFPDVYTRLQAASTCSTTTVFSIMVGSLFITGFSLMGGKILVITLFFMISSPVSGHIIARYAWRSGQVPWRRPTWKR